MSEKRNKENKNLEMPVGKYKGQPIEILAKDPEYMDWIISQKWFRDKFADHYTLIINNFSEPSDTPEHNSMQVKFLDKEYFEKFSIYAFSFFSEKVDKYKLLEIDGIDFEPDEGGDVMLNVKYNPINLLGCKWHLNCNDIENDYNSDLKCENIEEYTKWDKDKMIIELKPSIGDDYPTILRTIKRIKNHKRCILFKRFECEGATLDQVKATFGTCGILLIQESEIL